MFRSMKNRLSLFLIKERILRSSTKQNVSEEKDIFTALLKKATWPYMPHLLQSFSKAHAQANMDHMIKTFLKVHI